MYMLPNFIILHVIVVLEYIGLFAILSIVGINYSYMSPNFT